MKTTKLMVIAGLAGALIGLSNLSSTTASAASVKTIQKAQTKAVLQKYLPITMLKLNLSTFQD